MLLLRFFLSWVVSLCLFVSYVILALWPRKLQFSSPLLFLLFVDVLSDEPKQNQGRELVDRKLVQGPRSFYYWPSRGGM